MPTTLTADALGQYLRPGTRVYWPGCAGQSPLFEQWLRAEPDLASGVHFSGMWIPGVNRFDPTGLHAEARATAFFLLPELHAGWQRGAVDHLPLHYSEAVQWLGTPGRFDLLLLHLAPPDARGRCSLSLAADFTPAVLAGLTAGARVLAHINPQLPATRGPWVDAARIGAWVHADVPPLELHDGPLDSATDATTDTAIDAVARQVAGCIHDGDTLQFGLGRLQAAVMHALAGHRRLRIHSGMVSSGLLGLAAAGALAACEAGDDGPLPPVCTGVALGSSALYSRMADAELVRFAPVQHTHAQATLAGIPNFVSINSALEIDLLGQVNCETLHGRQVSGVGGLVDFLRGARASPGGRAIVAGTATAGRAGASRIVPLLAPGPVGVARGDVDLVVTEYGVARLRHLGVEARAKALISVAAPAHRAALEAAWHTLKCTL